MRHNTENNNCNLEHETPLHLNAATKEELNKQYKTTKTDKTPQI